MSALGESFAFPRDSICEGFGGMTYRQWLIGQALAGATLGSSANATHAKYAVEITDEVLKLLENQEAAK